MVYNWFILKDDTAFMFCVLGGFGTPPSFLLTSQLFVAFLVKTVVKQ